MTIQEYYQNFCYCFSRLFNDGVLCDESNLSYKYKRKKSISLRRSDYLIPAYVTFTITLYFSENRYGHFTVTCNARSNKSELELAEFDVNYKNESVIESWHSPEVRVYNDEVDRNPDFFYCIIEEIHYKLIEALKDKEELIDFYGYDDEDDKFNYGFEYDDFEEDDDEFGYEY